MRYVFQMRVLLVTFFLVICFSGNLISQVEPIEKEILEHITPVDYLVNGRSLILENIKKGNSKKVKEIYFHLIEKNQSSYETFHPQEEILINYYLGNYNVVLKKVLPKNYPGPKHDWSNKLLYISWDQLGIELSEIISSFEFTIIDEITSSFETEETKDLLILLLHYYSSTERYNDIDAPLNKEADKFLRKHPKSNYNGFIKNYVRFVLIDSKWSYGSSLGIGQGTFDGDLSNHFKNHFILNGDLDILFNNWFSTMEFEIGSSSPKDSIVFSQGIWKKGMNSNVVSSRFALGHVFQRNRFRFIPNAGMGTVSILAAKDSEKSDDYNEMISNFRVKGTFAYVIGAILDIRVTPSNKFKYQYCSESYGYIRFKYTFRQPYFFHRFEDYDGSLHSISVGYGGYIKLRKNDYQKKIKSNNYQY